jgi:hypothetical protein
MVLVAVVVVVVVVVAGAVVADGAIGAMTPTIGRTGPKLFKKRRRTTTEGKGPRQKSRKKVSQTTLLYVILIY